MVMKRKVIQHRPQRSGGVSISDVACLVVLITVGSREEAQRIARQLVEHRLAACVNIMQAVESWFWWQGKIDQSSEALLIVKTVPARLPVLIDRVRAWHSYDSPEIIALPVVGGDADYLKWVFNSCADSSTTRSV